MTAARQLVAIAIAIATSALAACGGGDPPGFDSPESVLHDPEADVYLVSNVNGGPTAKDDNGYISRLTPDGPMQRYWIAGGRNGVTLHAPKGMALHDHVLWVTDIDVIRRFDVRSGAPLGDIAIPGATFLADASAGPDGSVFVSDRGLDGNFLPTGTDAIWRLARDGTVTPLIRGLELGQPSGIVATPGGVYVVSWRDGTFYQVDSRGARFDLGKAPMAQLDGLVRIEAQTPGAPPAWLTTSWAGKCIYRFDLTGGVTRLPGVFEQPADCGFDAQRRLLLVPLFGSHRLERRSL